MRRKITESERKITESEQEIGGGDLPELTEQQRNFVFLILQGQSASDAYRMSYDCSNSKPNTVWCEASKLKSNPNVAQWIAAARKAGENKAKLTIDNHLAELERLKEIAIEKGNLGAAVQAENFRGKVAGHYAEKLEISAGDPLDALKEIGRLAPDIARQLAEASGIQWQSDDSPTTH